MFDFANRDRPSMLQTGAAPIVYFGIWIACWYLAELGLKLLTIVRGQTGDWLQLVFNSIVAPGIAAYYGGLLIYRLFRRANVPVVFILFAGSVLIFSGFGAAMIFINPEPDEHPVFSALLFLVLMVSSVVGSYNAATDADTY